MFRSFRIVNSQSDPLIISEIEFGQVPMQMLFATVLIYALHPALKDAEIAFRRVRMSIVPHVFFALVVDDLMLGKFLPQRHVVAGLIGHQPCLFGDVFAQDRADIMLRDVHKHCALGLAGVAVDQRQHLHLVVPRAADGLPSLPADERFVTFDDAAASAERNGQIASPHGLAKPVRRKPSGVDGAAERAGQLVAGNALLAAAKQVRGLKPLVQLQVSGLENRALGAAELALAVVALPQAKAGAALLVLYPFQSVNAVHSSAMRASRAFRPQNPL